MQNLTKFLPQDCGNSILRHVLGILLVALIFLTACSATNQAYHYSKADLSAREIVSLYNDVPYVKGEGAQHFIEDLVVPDWDLALQAGYAGEVVVFVLVDEKGELEAAFIKQSGGELIDNAVIDALKMSKFASFDEITSKVSKYTVAISYDTSAGTFQLAPINLRLDNTLVAATR